MEERTFELDDEVYLFSSDGNLYQGKIIEKINSLYRIETEVSKKLSSFIFIYKKNRDEESLINEIDFNIDYLERMKKKINYNNGA